jgi:hypothetical protein
MSGRRNREATSRECCVESMKSRVGKTVGSKMCARRPVMKAVARIRRLWAMIRRSPRSATVDRRDGEDGIDGISSTTVDRLHGGGREVENTYVEWPSTSVSGAYSPCYLCGALYKHEADSLRVSCKSRQKCRQPVKSISDYTLARRASQTSLAYDRHLHSSQLRARAFRGDISRVCK